MGWLFAALLFGIAHGFVSGPVHLFPAALLAGSTERSENYRRPGGPIPDISRKPAFFWQSEDSETVPQNIWILFGGNGDVALGWIALVRNLSRPDTGLLQEPFISAADKILDVLTERVPDAAN